METITVPIAATILGITRYEVLQLGRDGKLVLTKDGNNREIVTMKSVNDYRLARDREMAQRRREATGRMGII